MLISAIKCSEARFFSAAVCVSPTFLLCAVTLRFHFSGLRLAGWGTSDGAEEGLNGVSAVVDLGVVKV